MPKHKKIAVLFCFFTHILFADYAWIPKYQTLWLKGGFDYSKSKENFDSNGFKTDLLSSGVAAEFSESRFFLEGEYGFAQDFSLGFKPTFVSNQIDPQSSSATVFPSGTGLSDAFLSIKWNTVQVPFLLTFEVLGKLPLYSTGGIGTDQLATGDGDFALGLISHGGFRLGHKLVAGVSPGILFRADGYNTQFLLQSFLGFSHAQFLARIFFDWRVGLGKVQPTVPVTFNSAVGSGGTFARLSKNTDSFLLGAKIGYRFSPKYRFDINVGQTANGNRAANYWQLGAGLVVYLDYYKEEKKTKIHEVPFDAPPEVDEEG